MNAQPRAARFKRPESVLVVIYTRDGSVLMLKRADHPLFWQSVTGSLEWDEHDLRAVAARELMEETGLRADARLRDWDTRHRYVIFPEWRARYAPGVTENTEHMFSLELDAPQAVTLNPKEHSEYRWLPFGEAARLATSWSNRDAILKIEAERHRRA